MSCKIRLFFGSIILFSSLQTTVMATNFQEVCTIVVRYLKNPAQVGEIAPMSEQTGMELAKFVGQANSDKPCNYLEAGGGCGAVSICIAKKMRPQDHLDVIEIDPNMCEILKERLKDFENVSVHCCSILDWNPGFTYDGIVCTLPFNSLGVQFAQATMQHFEALANNNCTLSYVEYPIINSFLQYFYGSERQHMFRTVQAYMKNVRQGRLQQQSFILMNVPPTEVYHLSLA